MRGLAVDQVLAAPRSLQLNDVDLDGTTTVRLPLSQHAHDRHGMEGLRRLQALGAEDILLPAERGVPQGDVASPFG